MLAPRITIGLEIRPPVLTGARTVAPGGSGVTVRPSGRLALGPQEEPAVLPSITG